MSSSGTRSTGDAQLDQVATQMEEAFKAKDAKRLASLYADDAVVMPPNHGMVKGRAAIEAWFREPMGRIASVHIAPTRTSILGDDAYQIGTFVTALQGDSATGQNSFKYVLIFKKISAQWLVAFDIWNGD